VIQNASDTGNGDALVFFLFDLLHLDGEPDSARPLKASADRYRTLSRNDELSRAIPARRSTSHSSAACIGTRLPQNRWESGEYLAKLSKPGLSSRRQ
jgi:hypothetical protein